MKQVLMIQYIISKMGKGENLMILKIDKALKK